MEKLPQDFPNFEVYRIPVLIASSVISIIGIILHTLIIIFGRQNLRTSNQDSKSSFFFFQIHSGFAIFNLFLGGSLALRHEIIFPYGVFLCYGWVGYLGVPRLCSIMDFFPEQWVSFSPVIITFNMFFRYIAISDWNIKFTRFRIFLILVFFFLVTIPFPSFGTAKYITLTDSQLNVTSSLQHEMSKVTHFFIILDPTMMTLLNIYNILASSCIAAALVIALLARRSLKKKFSDFSASPKTTGMVKAYLRVLVLDALMMGIYTIVTQNSRISPPAIFKFYIDLFNYPTLALPTVFQAIFMFSSVPYQRIALCKLFRIKSVQNTIIPEQVISETSPSGSDIPANVAITEANRTELTEAPLTVVPLANSNTLLIVPMGGLLKPQAQFLATIE